jgi:Tol biopolymer transport system component
MNRNFLPVVAWTLTASLAAGCERELVEPTLHGDATASVTAAGFSGWSSAINLELASPGADPTFNTSALDGCPFTSRDGKTFYMASNRPGGLGGIDIWVSRRAHADEPWGPPVNLGAPVNSEVDDFCPTIDRDGHRFFFVSRRAIAGSCGGSDIYVTRFRNDGGFEAPVNLGCDVNSAFDDGQPNLRRDGLELFFYSTRPDPDALGGPDLYVATRESTGDPWSTPINLGPNVNSPAGETRPSLSWDGTTLYFGSTRPESEAASADIYVTTRDKLTGSQ